MKCIRRQQGLLNKFNQIQIIDVVPLNADIHCKLSWQAAVICPTEVHSWEGHLYWSQKEISKSGVQNAQWKWNFNFRDETQNLLSSKNQFAQFTYLNFLACDAYIIPMQCDTPLTIYIYIYFHRRGTLPHTLGLLYLLTFLSTVIIILIQARRQLFMAWLRLFLDRRGTQCYP